MVSTDPHFIAGKPISVRGRLLITACLMLVAIVLGSATSVALYQANRETLRHSEALGYVLCGEGQHVDDVPTEERKARRLICRNDAGAEVGARNSLIAAKMSIPFILLFAIPGMMLAWMVDWRQASR